MPKGIQHVAYVRVDFTSLNNSPRAGRRPVPGEEDDDHDHDDDDDDDAIVDESVTAMVTRVGRVCLKSREQITEKDKR